MAIVENMKIYEAVRTVPQEAKKAINGGRLKGMTDINPMWRIKKLTEIFGVVGIGWYYEIVREWIEEGANGEKSAFVKIHLYIKHEGEWSKPIVGVGGNSLVTKEKAGLYTSDECFKMALTDAISVSCKALGFGADVYYEKDRTKYDTQQDNSQVQGNSNNIHVVLTDKQISRALFKAKEIGQGEKELVEWIAKRYRKTNLKELTKQEYDKLCEALDKAKEQPQAV